MGVNFLDATATVTIPWAEYDALIRASERANIIKEKLMSGEYITQSDIAMVMSVEIQKIQEGE